MTTWCRRHRGGYPQQHCAVVKACWVEPKRPEPKERARPLCSAYGRGVNGLTEYIHTESDLDVLQFDAFFLRHEPSLQLLLFVHLELRVKSVELFYSLSLFECIGFLLIYTASWSSFLSHDSVSQRFSVRFLERNTSVFTSFMPILVAFPSHHPAHYSCLQEPQTP